MNPRITRLRKQSLTVKPFIDIERAKLITEAYQTYQGKVPINFESISLQTPFRE